MPGVLFPLGIEKTDKFKPTTSRPHALHLQSYSSASVWRGTEGGGVDAHRKRHLIQDYPKPGNKRKGAYGCCLDLFVSRYTSEIANSATESDLEREASASAYDMPSTKP